MSKYYDYFEEQAHNPDEVTMDEFIAEAMRTDFEIQYFSGGITISTNVQNNTHE